MANNDMIEVSEGIYMSRNLILEIIKKCNPNTAIWDALTKDRKKNG